VTSTRKVRAPFHEEGFVLIEILVSALVLTIASAGVVTLLATTTGSQAEQRHSSEAYALAQEDQARMASMRLSTLNRLDQTRTVKLNKTNFQVRSRGVFINDKTSTPSCGVGTSSADYVEITSSVSWNGMNPGEKAKIVSLLSPSNGSLDSNNGTLAISVTTQSQVPVPNVYVSGGSGAFAGYTGASGCAVFADLPAATYSTTISGEAAGVVNKNGSYTEQKSLTAVGGDTKTTAFEFDRPGTIPVNFKYRVGSSSEFKTSGADSVVANNSGMTAGRVIWTPGTLREPTVNATPLFPFTSTYFLYAGSCASNNPDPEGKGLNPAAVASVVAPRGGTAAAATLQLPALETVVKNGSTALAGAKVTITDKACKDANGNFVKRTYTTNAAGMPSNSQTGLAELGLPWGSYDLCVSANIAGTNRRKTVPAVTVKNLAAATLAGGTTSTIDLGSGAETGTGMTCP
jgi:Tfp pilus assembly protein PilV